MPACFCHAGACCAEVPTGRSAEYWAQAGRATAPVVRRTTARMEMRRITSQDTPPAHKSGERMQVNGFSSADRFARRIENLHDNHVGVEGGEVAMGMQIAAHDGRQVVQRGVLGRSERRRSERLFRRMLAESLPHLGWGF